MNPERL